MPRRKQQAPRRSAGNARGRAVGSGPGGGRGGRGRAGAAGDTPPGGRGGPKLGGGRAPPAPGPRAERKLIGAARRRDGPGRPGRPRPPVLRGGRCLALPRAGRALGKEVAAWRPEHAEKSPPKAGRLNLTLENKVSSPGREECGPRVSLENSSL